MEEMLQELVDSLSHYLTICKVLYNSVGGLGFLNHQQYHDYPNYGDTEILHQLTNSLSKPSRISYIQAIQDFGHAINDAMFTTCLGKL